MDLDSDFVRIRFSIRIRIRFSIRIRVRVRVRVRVTLIVDVSCSGVVGTDEVLSRPLNTRSPTSSDLSISLKLPHKASHHQPKSVRQHH